MKFIISLVIFVLLSFGCCSTKYNVDNLPEVKVTFGSGGGFAGTVSKYMLLENGQLLSSTSLKNDGYSEYSDCKRKGKKLFRKVNKTNFKSNLISSPGNMYYFISKNDSTLVWGASEPNESILELYKELQDLAKASKPKEIIK